MKIALTSFCFVLACAFVCFSPIYAVLATRLHSGSADQIKKSEDAQVTSSADGHYKLEQGMIIIEPSSDAIIDTTFCQVTVKPHSAALICRELDVTRVINLFDWRTGCVSVESGGMSRKISQASEVAVIMAKDGKEAEQLLLADHLHRRKLKVEKAGEYFMAHDQISVRDCALKLPILLDLFASSDRSDKKMMDKIIKTAAAMALTEAAEPYSTFE